MTNSRIVPIDITVPSAVLSQESFVQEAITIGAELYTASLIEDLGIEAQVEINLTSQSENEKCFEIAIDGQAAKTDITTQVTSWPESICSEIYRNRELLIPNDDSASKKIAQGPGGTKARFLARLNRCSNLDETDYSAQVIVGLNSDWYYQNWYLKFDDSKLEELQKSFYEVTGLPCNPPIVQTDDRLANGEFQITLNDVRLPPYQITVDSPFEVISEALKSAMLNDPGCFLTKSILKSYITQIEPLMPRLVEYVLSNIGFDMLFEVLIQLVEEGICIKNFDGILNIFTRPPTLHFTDETAYIVFGPEAEPALRVEAERPLLASDWVRFVRSNMKREISHQYARREATNNRGINFDMDVYLLDIAIEQQLEGGDFTEDLQDLVRATHNEIGNNAAIVLTGEGVRRKYWEVIHRGLPKISVLAFQELSPSLSLNALARISLG